VESRLSQNRIVPFESVRAGDVILTKAPGGPICGLVVAHRAWFFDLSLAPLRLLRERFSERMCADEAFWDAKQSARFATIIEVTNPLPIAPVACDKNDRRGWVILHDRGDQLSLW